MISLLSRRNCIFFNIKFIKDVLEEQIASQQAIELEHKYGAQNYHPLPVVLNRGEGFMFGM